MFKFTNAEMTPQKARPKQARAKKSYLTLYVMCVVFLDENWTFLKYKIDVCVQYNRISAYRPFAYTNIVLRTV